MAQATLRRINKLSILLYLGLFPYGQIPAFLLSMSFGHLRSLHPSDVALAVFVGSSLLLYPTLFRKTFRSYIGKLFVVLAFGIIINAFTGVFSITALMYAARLVVYILAGYCFAIVKPFRSKQIVTILLTIGGTIVLLGLLQYFFVPDTRPLRIFGWDDHYFRLVGTFLDPAYIGILVVMTGLLAFVKLKSGFFKYIFLGSTFLALLLTYSRASYLALLVGVFVLMISRSKSVLRLSLFALLFISCLYLLPRPSSEGVKLERTFSVLLRIKNYKETLSIWQTSPLFGVGYNNICEARERLAEAPNTTLISHSCSGSDNSFLLLLATTGVIGVISAIYGAILLYYNIPKSEKPLVLSLSISIFLHSFFSNTLFYPWIMGWMALYVGTVMRSFKVKEKK